MNPARKAAAVTMSEALASLLERARVLAELAETMPRFCGMCEACVPSDFVCDSWTDVPAVFEALDGLRDAVRDVERAEMRRATGGDADV